MSAKRMTEASVKNTKATGQRQEIADTVVPGLYLVVQPKRTDGKPAGKSWAVRARLHGKTLKYKLGDWPAYELGSVDSEVVTARSLAQAAMNAIGRGEDPRAIRNAERDNTVRAAAEHWMETDQEGNKRRRVDETRRMLDKTVLPAIGDKPITEVTRADCRRIIRTVAARAPVMGNRYRALLHRLFAWLVEQDELPLSPAAGIPNPTKPKTIERDRVLSYDELAQVWHAAEDIGWPFGPAVQLLILTAARRTEIGELCWPEVGDDAITLAGARTKTANERTIPLSGRARAILDDLRETRYIAPIEGAPAYVFTTTGRTAVSGWSKAKAQIDARCPDVAPWRLHDLRRTAATGLQRLGVRLEVTEAVLGHLSGASGGIVGIYQRHDYADEKRAALEAWARHVAVTVGIAEPEEKVVAIR